MSNNLNVDLTGKTVMVLKKYLRPEVTDRRFHCESGFGCSANTNGESIYGFWVSDKEKDKIRGSWVEELASDNVKNTLDNFFKGL